MNTVFRFCIVILLYCFGAVCHADSLVLECSGSVDASIESKLISRLAEDVVQRKSVHELVVRTSAGTRTFVDKPPHDEPLSGLHYYFCDRNGGYILLRVEDETLASGRMIDEATGKVIPGGESVNFSPDGRAYLTWEQPDGLDGSLLKVYSKNGALSWSGFSFIPEANNRDRIYASLENPSWGVGGKLYADATCAGAQKKWRVTLTKTYSTWDWSPQKKCR
jgi:hypothetical protein